MGKIWGPPLLKKKNSFPASLTSTDPVLAATRTPNTTLVSGGRIFIQAEAGIRDPSVTGVQTCALPISGLPPRLGRTRQPARGAAQPVQGNRPDRKSVVEGKRVDLGGRRIITKKRY